MADTDPSKTGGGPKSLNMESMLRAAKEAIAMLCDINQDDVVVDSDNSISYGSDTSSTYVIVWPNLDPDDNEASYSFQAKLLADTKEQPSLYNLLNDINKDLIYGQVFFSDGDIILYYRLIIESPSPAPIAAILTYMLEAADDYDEKLKLRLGGRRLIEIEEDEIEV